MLNYKFPLSLIIAFIGIFSGLQAQQVRDLTSNVHCIDTFTLGGVFYKCDGCNADAFMKTNEEVVRYFNFARRFEERQLSLTPMSLGTLVLPSDYTSYSPAGQAFYIVNEERKCRKLSPFTNIEEGLCIFATKHAEFIREDVHANMGHTGRNGETFDSRRSNIYKGWKPANEPCYAGYHESVLENCANTDGMSVTVGKSLFQWIYRDSDSNWGHRQTCFRSGSQYCFGFGVKQWIAVMECGVPLTTGNCNNQIKYLGLTEKLVMPTPVASSGNCGNSNPSQKRSELNKDECMNLGQMGDALTSPDGKYSLSIQGDGDLVLRYNYNSLWSSNTSNQGVTKLIFQGDGNLVLYTSSNVAKWAVDAHGKGGHKLVLQNDGNLVIYKQDGSPVWALKMENGQYTPSGGKGWLR